MRLQVVIIAFFVKFCDSNLTQRLEGYRPCTPDIARLRWSLSAQQSIIIEYDWDEYNCSFTVKFGEFRADKLFVFIKNYKEVSGYCIDYVQIGHTIQYIGKRFCDNIEIEDDTRNEVYINIYVSHSYPKEMLEVSMIISSYSTCERNKDLPCKHIRDASCFYYDFRSNGAPKCLPMCRDEEGNCVSSGGLDIKRSDTSSYITKNIAYAIGMLIVIIGLSWRYRTCLKAAQLVTTRPNEDVPTIEMPTSPIAAGAAGSNTEAAAPPIKDLPPSYESLFPER